MMKRITGLFITLVMVMSFMPARIASAAYSGTCGGNVTWVLDNGTLTISGTGEMQDWASSSNVPWYKYRDNICNIVIEDGVTGIGDDAFWYCRSLTSITIPDSVTGIGAYAFYYCSSLTSITIPDSVTGIGAYAFDFCSSLTSITIPDSVTSIGDRAFYYCSSLTSITIPDSVTSIGDRAFYGCSSLTSINVSEDNMNYCSIDGNLFNKQKSTLIQYTPGKKESEYIIPNGVTSIGDGAFWGCDNLTSITIPDSVTSIGDGAFLGCDSLTSITIPDSVTSIGDWAFYSCDSLTSITIPDSVTSIGDDAFGYCSGLTSITIPDSVTSIGDDAFAYCSSLTSITIPDSVTSIGDGAFLGCDSLTSITIPDSVTSIGDWAFGYCSGLTSITIPDSVTSIGAYAFEDCKSLTSITIPDSVTSIDHHAFYECDNLIIHVIENSYAHKYVVANGISFVAVSDKCELLNEVDISNITTKELTYTITPQVSEKATYQIYDNNMNLLNSDTLSLEYGDNKFTIRVTAENGEYADYPIKIYVQSNKCELLNKDDISNIVSDHLSYTIEPQISEKATYQIYDGNSEPVIGDVLSLVPGENKLTVRVTAENGEYADYSIIIFAVSDKHELLNKDDISNVTTKELSYTIEPQISERATYQIYDSNMNLLNSDTLSLDYGDNKFTIRVTAENGEYADYPITIYVKSNKCELLNKNDISNIVSKHLSYTIEPQVSEKATYQIYDSNMNLLNSDTLSLEYGDNKFTIRVTAENGEYADYPIMIYTESNKCELLNQDALSCEVSNAVSEYVLTPQVSDKAAYEIFDAEGAMLDGDTALLSVGQNVFSIKVTAENGIDFKTYTITIKRREKLNAVVSSLESGYYAFENGSVQLTLENDHPSARIYYTVDGTEPTRESKLYSGAEDIGDAVTVKAFAVLDGYDDSDVTTIELKRAVAPTNLKIQSIASKSAVLVYNVPSGVKKYEICYSVNRGRNWYVGFESTDVGRYINVGGLSPVTEYMFKVKTYYSCGTALESNSILGKTTVYVSDECDILRTWSPYEAEIDNDNRTITGARVMNSYSEMELDVDVSDKASWSVYKTLSDARQSKNEITNKVIELSNEGGENYAYIKVVAENGYNEKIYKVIVYRQSKSAKPRVSIKSNYVLKDTKVELFADGEIIKYTTDGTEPSEANGTVYTEPIVISDDRTILKIAAKESDKDEYSDVVTQIYYIADDIGDITVTTLNTPENPRWEDKAALWDAAEDASGYIIQLYKDNEIYGNAVETVDNYFDFSSCIAEEGAYSFTVTAKGDGLYYENSVTSNMSDVYNFAPAENNKVVITESLIQLSGITEPCTAVFAVYKEGKMTGCTTENVDNDMSTEINSLGLELDKADEIKVFLWKSLDSMIPMGKSAGGKLN